jgi:hypothetical protein
MAEPRLRGHALLDANTRLWGWLIPSVPVVSEQAAGIHVCVYPCLLLGAHTTPASYHASASGHSRVQRTMHEGQIKFVCTSRYQCRGCRMLSEARRRAPEHRTGLCADVQGTDSQARLDGRERDGTGQVVSRRSARGFRTTARTWELLSKLR